VSLILQTAVISRSAAGPGLEGWSKNLRTSLISWSYGRLRLEEGISISQGRLAVEISLELPGLFTFGKPEKPLKRQLAKLLTIGVSELEFLVQVLSQLCH
jgi:hypothetical protein